MDDFPDDKRPWHESIERPYNEYEALMKCAPGVEPERSISELLVLRELLADAFEQLDPLEQWVFNLVVIESYSLRCMEPSVPKTTVARIRDRAIEKLQHSLVEHPEVIAYLESQ